MKGPVRTWLVIVYLMILLMVLIGGITRLTGSGLSMVEWRPLFGALPPMNEAEWLRVFERYQAFPQYQKVNSWMALADFKRIFFWEYLHRLFGRVIGVVFFLPWVYFMARKRLTGPWARRTFIAFLLGGSQGLLGWFMVKSGLVDMPRVSHFRLAAHLSLAFFVGQYVWWLILDATWPLRGSEARGGEGDVGPAPRWSWAFIALMSLQIVYGAFMAGTRAGFVSATWPDINGMWIPSQMGTLEPWVRDLTENVFSIHFIHRSLGYVTFLAAIALGWAARRGSARQRRAGFLLSGLALVQVALGVVTVVLHVPVWVAAAHQGVAYLLLSAAVLLLHASAAKAAPGGAVASP